MSDLHVIFWHIWAVVSGCYPGRLAESAMGNYELMLDIYVFS